MNIRTVKQSLTVAAVVIALCYASYLVGQWKRNNQGAIVPPSAPVTASVDYECKGPLKIYNKDELKAAKVIPKQVASDTGKQVTATGTLHDDSGTTHVSSVLDEKSGQSVIMKERPTAETFLAHEIGIGYSVGSLGAGPALRYRGTFGRVWGLYGEAQVEGWRWQWGPRLDDDHRYDGQVSAFVTHRF